MQDIQYFNSPFDSQAVSYVKEITSNNGFECVLYAEKEIEKKIDKEYQRGKKNFIVDGFIYFCPNRNYERPLQVLTDWGIPCVLLRRKTKVKSVTSILNNDNEAIRAAAQHLHDSGHRVMGYCGGRISAVSQEREIVYRDFVKTMQMPFSESLVIKNNKTFEQDLDRLLAHSPLPTSFLCFNDQVAVELIKSLKARSVKIPEDIAVVGFDNAYVAEMVSPALTTVHVPLKDMVDLAFRTLQDQINGIQTKGVTIVVDNELIIRESSLPAKG